jgi:hypothetical protein
MRSSPLVAADLMTLLSFCQVSRRKQIAGALAAPTKAKAETHANEFLKKYQVRGSFLLVQLRYVKANEVPSQAAS